MDAAARRLAVHRLHSALVIALAGGGARRQDLLEPFQVFVGQLHLQGADVLVEVADVLGAGDRDDVLALRQDPGQCELRGVAPLLLRQSFDLFDELQVLLEILALEPRMVLAEITFREVRRRLEAA